MLIHNSGGGGKYSPVALESSAVISRNRFTLKTVDFEKVKGFSFKKCSLNNSRLTVHLRESVLYSWGSFSSSVEQSDRPLFFSMLVVLFEVFIPK